MPSAAPGVIDVHVHFLPERYRQIAVEAGFELADGLAPPGLPHWNIERHIQVMDEAGIQTALLSISSPGILFWEDPAKVADLARIVNEAGAQARADHPGRFGFLASLPLPDVDRALTELEHAFDVLGADGVVLMSNYGGVYPGDPAFAPVFAELARREAVVLLHPTSPPCYPAGVLREWQRPMVEFFFETTRTVSDLVLGRTLADNPGIRFVVPHAGASLPAVASRINRNVIRRNGARSSDAPVLPDFYEALGELYFDVAGSSLPDQIPSLLRIARHDRIVYGSDWPFTNEITGRDMRAQFDTSVDLDDTLRAAILRDNALRLFPRLSVSEAGG